MKSSAPTLARWRGTAMKPLSFVSRWWHAYGVLLATHPSAALDIMQDLLDWLRWVPIAQLKQL